MAMSVVYTTFAGEIVHENRGGVERDYMPDPLGSTAALLDSTQPMTDTWVYWPYGEVQKRTGSNVTPFGFVGLLGYFTDAVKSIYVRARYLRPDLGRWQTVDPLWPSEGAFAYGKRSPVSYRAPSGLSIGNDLWNCINSWSQIGYSEISACEWCQRELNYHGGFMCTRLSNAGSKVPDDGMVWPWMTGYDLLPAAVPCSISAGFPFGTLMDPGDSACESICTHASVGREDTFLNLRKKWCKELCNKIRSGGCRKLEDACDRICTTPGNVSRQCEYCLFFYDAAGCPATIVTGE